MYSASPEISRRSGQLRTIRMANHRQYRAGRVACHRAAHTTVIEAIRSVQRRTHRYGAYAGSGWMLLLTFMAVMNNLHDGETNAIEGHQPLCPVRRIRGAGDDGVGLTARF